MAFPLLDIEGPGTEIASRLAVYGDRKVHVIVFPPSEPPTALDSRPIAEALAEIAAQISSSDAESVPDDCTDQLDHYI